MDTPKKRGFAAMDPEQLRALASKGGKACQAKGKGRRWNTEQAREAGRRGGLAGKQRKANAA